MPSARSLFAAGAPAVPPTGAALSRNPSSDTILAFRPRSSVVASFMVIRYSHVSSRASPR